MTPEQLKQQLSQARLDRDSSEAVIAMVIGRVGGTVEGHPTARHNFLQRIDELVEHEEMYLALMERVKGITCECGATEHEYGCRNDGSAVVFSGDGQSWVLCSQCQRH